MRKLPGNDLGWLFKGAVMTVKLTGRGLRNQTVQSAILQMRKQSPQETRWLAGGYRSLAQPSSLSPVFTLHHPDFLTAEMGINPNAGLLLSLWITSLGTTGYTFIWVAVT